MSDEGASIRALAKMIQSSPTTVMKMRKDLDDWHPDENGRIQVRTVRGLDGKLRPGRRFDTTERDDNIRLRRSSGQTIRAIADAVGCSVGTVHRILKETS
ncbi:MAG: hypothetical protein EPO52_01505 [Herbiconiux sp.]|uniref:helix-turn-helix domain-containing protein n=1 Tax=Herbiconiux sp. TaxID=1871186 RepID=UPI0011FB5C81|nr:helix-turn-helix domain-containing protein [Herbiconiux sp.]TAJ49663.1 MAG: hypothetical protein EPO52_01505 [Herbiconiux sp.]